jgi:tape measure domain-containing protein
MADIVIKITDQIGKDIIDKLKALEKTGDSASKSLKELKDSANGLKAVASSVSSLATMQERLTSANTKEELSQIKVNQAREKAVLATQLLNERLKQQEIRTQINNERLAQAEQRTNKMAQATQNLTNKNEALASTLQAISVGYRLFIGSVIINKVTDLVDSYTLMENRLKLVATSTSNVSALQKELFQNAQSARVPIVELTQSFVRYDFALKELGASQKESLRFTKTLSELLQISGLNTQEASSSLLQLSQALNKGKLDGDEFRTVMETLPTLAEAIAKEMGVARGELLKLAPQGKITSDIIRKALASLADETDARFKELGSTVSQGFTVIKNGAIEFIGDFNKATGASKILADSLIFIGNNIKSVFVVSIGLGTYALSQYIIKLNLATISTEGFGIATALANKATNAFLRTMYFLTETSVASTAGITSVATAVAVLTTYIVLNKDSMELASQSGVVLQDTFTALNQIFKETSANALLAKIGLSGIADSFFDLKNFEPTNVLNNTILLLAKVQDILSTGTTNTNFFDEILDKQEKVTQARLKAIEVQKRQIEETNKEAVVNRALDEAKRLTKDERKKTNTEAEDLQAQLQETTEVYDKAILNLKNSFKEYVGEYSANNSIIIGLEESKARAIQYIQEGGAKGEKARQKEANDLLKKQEEILDNLTIGTKEYIRTKEALDGLISKGNITWEQYNQILDQTTLVQRKIRLEEAIAIKNADTLYDKKRVQAKLESDRLKAENEAVKSITNKDEYITNIDLINQNLKKALADIDLEEQKADNKKEARGEKEYNRIVNGFKKIINEFGKFLKDKENLQAESNKREDEFNLRFEQRKSGLTFQGANPVGQLFAENAGIDNTLEKQRIDNAEQARRAELENAKGLQNDLIKIKKDGQEKLNELERLANEKKATNRLKIASLELGATSQLFESLSNLAKAREGENSKTAKRLFIASKALALGQAIVNTAESISEANKLPIPAKFPAIAFAGATGASAISTIIATSLQGLAKGGTVGGFGSTTSDSNLVFLSRGEEVIRESVARPNRGFLKDLNDGKVDTSNLNRTFTNQRQTGSKPVINIHNYSDANVTVDHREVDGQDHFDVQIKRIEDKLAQNVSNGDGNLHSVVKGLIGRGY